MEMLVLGSTIITGMAGGDRSHEAPPSLEAFDALDDPWPALWTILGTIAVAVLTGCVGGALTP